MTIEKPQPSLHLNPIDGRYDCMWNEGNRGRCIGYIIERQKGGYQFAPLPQLGEYDEPHFTAVMLMTLGVKLASFNNGTALELQSSMEVIAIEEQSLDKN